MNLGPVIFGRCSNPLLLWGCRTKLIAEVLGDIAKLFNQWSQVGWHRVTIYGDVKEPLTEFGKALGLQIIEET